MRFNIKYACVTNIQSPKFWVLVLPIKVIPERHVPRTRDGFVILFFFTFAFSCYIPDNNADKTKKQSQYREEYQRNKYRRIDILPHTNYHK